MIKGDNNAKYPAFKGVIDAMREESGIQVPAHYRSGVSSTGHRAVYEEE
jgi:hypothetical protein